MECDKFSALVCSESVRFGAYPTNEDVVHLSAEGFAAILDVTEPADHAKAALQNRVLYYECPSTWSRLHIPLPDRTPGTVDDAKTMVEWVLNILNTTNDGVYIHCRGGHGRSATIAALVVHALENTNHLQTIRIIRDVHRTRTIMDPKWRKLGAPQTQSQKRFIKQWIDTH